MDTERNGDENPTENEAPERGERIMTLHDLLVDHEAEMIAMMRRARTLTPEQVDRNTAAHDAYDLRPEERAAFDTGSMHRLEIR